ncbi:MAG: amidohydrolase [Betaproteobacteria bacterium]|nr:amidohydrolase [Betaproteobacteria bacterium]
MGAIEKPLFGIIGDIHAFHDELKSIRHDIHAHPETAFEEQRTSDVVAAKLSAWGYEVHRGLAKTGVVGVLRNGTSKRTIGLRADMDALHIHEKNAFAHKSQHAGKMHACGHDGHTTMLLGAAKYLAQHRNFDGTVNCIFQPAEENEGGARVMIEEGLFERFPCDTVWGMHNWPGMDAGQFCVMPGPMMAGFDIFEITLTGRGAHAAMPHNGWDPIVAGSALVQALQTIVSRNTHPVEAGVVSVTQFHGGDTWNVIPNEVVIRGTTRSFKPEVQALIQRRIGEICNGVAATYGCTVKFWYDRRYPPTVNSAAEAETSRSVLVDLVGAGNVHTDLTPTMGAEDFAFMLQAKPGCYVWIGNGAGEGGCMLHNPGYDFNDEILPLGASYWVKLVERCLG